VHVAVQRAGVAVTFLGHEDRNLVKNIERFTGNKVTLMEIEGLEPRTRSGNRGQSPKQDRKFRVRAPRQEPRKIGL